MAWVTITGGAGFIGSAVVREALQRGYSVKVLDNYSTGYRSNLDGLTGIEVIEGDVRDPEKVHRALEGVDGVFHLAANVGNVRSIEDPFYDSEVNILGTLRILEGMKSQGVSRIVYSSSGAIFGESKYIPVDEEHPVEPDSPYGVSKLAAEKMVRCYQRLYGWDVTCLRYFNAYGERQHFDAYGNVIPIFGTRLIEGKEITIYGDGTQTRDFVNVRDIAWANLQAFERKVSGVFNIATGQATRINDLAHKMIALAGVNTTPVHAHWRKGEVLHSRAKIDRARTELGFNPKVTLDEGLAEYYNWLRSSLRSETNRNSPV